MTASEGRVNRMDAQTYRSSVAPLLVQEYITERRGINLIKHQHESFNDFVFNRIPSVIVACNNIELHHEWMSENLAEQDANDTESDSACGQYRYRITIKITNPRMARPVGVEKDGSHTLLTPQEARLRGITYAASLYADVHVTTKTVVGVQPLEYSADEKIIQNVCVGKIPIMVRSKYCVIRTLPLTGMGDCRYDYGGYFIINGTEKVIISNDRMAENQTFVFENNKTNLSYSHTAEIRSVAWNHDGQLSVKSLILRASARQNQFGRYIRVALPHAKQDVPLMLLFRAFGVESDMEVIHLVTDGDSSEEIAIMRDYLTGSIAEGSDIRCARDALDALVRAMNCDGAHYKSKLDYVRNVIARDILPHTGRNFAGKAAYLGYMVRRLIRCMIGLDEPDDRDSYINKRVDTPGIMLASLFRVHYVRMIKELRNSLSREIAGGAWKPSGGFINVINKVNVTKHIKSSIIEAGMKYALATGNWNVKGITSLSSKIVSRKQGVAQVLNRLTYAATLSHLRRINTPMEKNGKMVQPRKLHNTQWGIICPSECFDPETPILMWDGTIKEAKAIVVGDHLIDDKGNSVRVKSTCSGFKTMYEIVPDKKNFMRCTVTDNHILTLKIKRFKEVGTSKGRSQVSWFDKKELRYRRRSFDDEKELNAFYASLDDDDVLDITIEKYQSLSPYVQNQMYVFKSNGINWERKEVTLDPYILGMWLGAGLSCGYGFATADKELLDKWIEWGAENGATIVPRTSEYSYGIISSIDMANNTKTEKSPLEKLLAQYGLVNNKHIPHEYLVNDRETRLAVLAGLIDTDGHVQANGHRIRISRGEKNYRILYDAEFLARSLGFSCHVNDRVCSYTVHGEERQTPCKELRITGTNLHELPTVLPRKKLDNPVAKNVSTSALQSSFQLIKKDVGPFVGWQLDGNGRFLLGDMSIQHNTPEGVSVGLVKNLAVLAGITVHSEPWLVVHRLVELGMRRADWRRTNSEGVVFVNGRIVGYDDDLSKLAHKLRDLKRAAVINVHTSVVLDTRNHALNVNTEAGRFVRPLLVVRDHTDLCLTCADVNDVKTGRKKWWNLVHEGKIEYLDVAEVNRSMIAMNLEELQKGARGILHAFKYTHMEIDPACIMGVPASCIPFSDHNQAPRNTYQSAMCKQAIGINVSNFNTRFDTVNHILHYPQRALVQTRTARLLRADKLPNGINAIVAIMTFTGYNQEDSILINRAAVQRGMFVSTMYKTFREQNNRNHANGEEEFFCKPNVASTRNMKPCNYDKLNPNGFVPENTMINENDIIIGKSMPQKVGSELIFRDNSVPYKGTDLAFVDRNCYQDNYFTTVNGDGYVFAKTRVRCMMEPVVGDKFSSRHAQKGTCGMIFDEWDMPFTADGIVPDIIMNSHAIPSRMTIAQLLEGMLSKAACVRGCTGHASAFQSGDFNTVADVLYSAGIQGHGDELMYDPHAGTQMKVPISLTPTYYQRLKHLSSQKVHSRAANGPVVLLTRQPTEGRSREGALRQGNMETHVLVAHGAMQFLTERMMTCSDNFRIFICNNCGMMADVNREQGMYTCRSCKHLAVNFSEVRVPYCCKLLCQEIASLGVGTRFVTA